MVNTFVTDDGTLTPADTTEASHKLFGRLNQVITKVDDLAVLDMNTTFGVTPSLSDQGTAIQEAIAVAETRGGGELVFRAPGYYMANTINASASGASSALLVAGNNIHITLGPGAILKSELAAPTTLLSVWGPAQAAGFANWVAHASVIKTSLQLDRAEVFPEGTFQVKAETPADAGAVAPGDPIYLRMGQTITLDSLNRQPFAELNEVLATDPDTGWITLRYPLTHTYQLHYFNTGTSGETNPTGPGTEAIFGFVNISDEVIRNFQMSGGRFETEGVSAVINADNILGGVWRDYEFSTKKHHIIANTQRFIRMERLRGTTLYEDGVDPLGVGAICWIAGAGTGTADAVYRDLYMAAPYSSIQMHVREGMNHCLVENVVSMGAPGRTLTNESNLAITSFAHDILVVGGHYANSGGTAHIVQTTSDTDRITLRDVEVSGATGSGATDGIFVNGTRSGVYNPILHDGLRARTSQTTNRDVDRIHLPAGLFRATTGSPTASAVNNWPTWSFPSTTETLVGTTTKFPRHWQRAFYKVRLVLINPGAGTGQAQMVVRISYVGSGETVAQLQENFTINVVASATPLRFDAQSAHILVPVEANIEDEVLIRVGRLGGTDDSLPDSLTGPIDLIGVYLEPAA